MNPFASQIVRPFVMVTVAIMCWWLYGPTGKAVAQAHDVTARLGNVAQAVERMGHVFDNPDLSRDWVAHVEAQISILRAEYDALATMPDGNRSALDALADCRLSGEHLRHALITGSRSHLLRSSDLLSSCSARLSEFGVAISAEWGAPITGGYGAVPVAATTPPVSLGALESAPVALTEITTLSAWLESSLANRVYTADLWAERLVASGRIVESSAPLASFLLNCLNTAASPDTMATLGGGYPLVEIATLCALSYTPQGEQAPSSSQPGTPFVCTGGCAVAPDPTCNIKGNVNPGTGTFIYHTPDSRFYDGTDVKPEEGDRWFCSVQEAESAGFRAPLQ